MNIPFLQALAAGGLVGDGAMGSLLYERGVYVNRNFDAVNLSQEELVYRIHRQYLLAGAHVLESNTYGANRLRLAKHGLADKTVAINQAAAKILRRAAEESAYLAGSLGPTGLTSGEVRRAESAVVEAYAEQAALLAEAGMDLLIVETFDNPGELKLAVRGARSVTELPIIAQIKIGDDGTVADGTPAADLAAEMVVWGAQGVGANCNGPEVVYETVAAMVDVGVPVCAFANAGRPQSIEDRLIYLATPENFGVFARRMFKAGVKMVGGCCGTSPDHINRVAAAARMVSPRSTALAKVLDSGTVNAADTPQPTPVAERSRLGALLGRRFVTSVEVNPGAGLSTAKQVEAARMLLEAGADVINIADGPRATVRMSNVALGQVLMAELDTEVILHVCCRDKNLLGLQAGLLGAHVQGFRNLVVITGDPPKVGDYPDATAVYDLDSIGLLRLVNGFNRGVDAAGKLIAHDAHTDFVLATGVEPAAADFEREMTRLRQKVEAGAEMVMTQPIYDPRHLERFLDASSDLDIPVLVGVLPLASYRNAEFLHNHIPGMHVPEQTRMRMKAAGKGDSARQEGVNIAIESLMGVYELVAGAYIMPPLGRYDMAAAIIRALPADRHLGDHIPGLRP